MTLAELGTILRGTHLADILVPGFIESSDGPTVFHSLNETFYFECDRVLLEMTTVGDTATMQLSIVEKVRHRFELDDDMQAASSSLSQLLLRDSVGDNPIVALCLWDVHEGAELCCAAARFDLANGQKVFVDPTYHFGIRVGDRPQEESWRENRPHLVDTSIVIPIRVIPT